jgi:DNA (cytosine-5)-methyltransferase 1
VEFFRLVQETSPAFFLTENVPNILNTRYDSLREKALSKLKKQYVVLEPLAINASDYGAPTSRRRIFFVGYKPKEFSSELTASCFALKRKDRTLCVRDALQGLPVDISPDWLTEELGWHPVKKLENNYFFRRTSGNIPTGVGEAKSVERYCKKNEVSGCMGTRHSVDVEERYRGLAYGRRDPVSRSTKLDPDGYCPTLRAGTGRDRGRFQAVRPIHYDPPRVITPREAARLQGFPDWFVFHATKWHSFRQIGSSVSPIVSERLLRVIFERL